MRLNIPLVLALNSFFSSSLFFVCFTLPSHLIRSVLLELWKVSLKGISVFGNRNWFLIRVLFGWISKLVHNRNNFCDHKNSLTQRFIVAEKKIPMKSQTIPIIHRVSFYLVTVIKFLWPERYQSLIFQSFLISTLFFSLCAMCFHLIS